VRPNDDDMQQGRGYSLGGSEINGKLSFAHNDDVERKRIGAEEI
jgi:hypothetical protein